MTFCRISQALLVQMSRLLEQELNRQLCQAHLVGLDAIDEQSAAALLFYARLHFGARLQGDLQFGVAFLPRGAKKRVLDDAFLALCWLGSTPKERVRRACQRS